MIKLVSRRVKQIASPFANLFEVYSYLKRSWAGTEIIIVVYHRVSIVDDQWSIDIVHPSSFENQLQYLRSNYVIVPLSGLLQYLQAHHPPSTKRIAALTFDDGYKDFLTYALPILNKYHIPATIFLATGYIGSGTLFWWDDVGYAIECTRRGVLNLGEFGNYKLDTLTQRRATALTIIERLKKLPNENRIRVIGELLSEADVNIPEKLANEVVLTWEDVRHISAAGISVEAHSVTHPVLTNMTLERAKREITESRSEIEKQLNRPVTFFAYPNGDCSPEIVKVLKEEGFVGAVTSNPAWISSRTNPYQLGRIGLYDEDCSIFKLRLSCIWHLA